MKGRHAAPREPRGHWLLLLTVLPLVFAAVLFEGWTTHQVANPGGRQACTSPAPASVDDGGPVRSYEHGRQVSDRAPAGTMALTVDGGPDPTWTPRVLDLLREKKAHATFFVNGAQAAQHPYLLKKIRAAGHEIGTLSYTGAPLGTASDLRRSMELSLDQKALAGATGYHTNLLRLPKSSAVDTLCGVEGDAANRATEDGYTVVAADKWYRDNDTGVVRQFSQTETGFAQAEQLLKSPGVKKFTTVTKATGRDPADERASSAEIWQGMALIAVRNVSHAFTGAMGWLLGVTIGLAALRLALLYFWARTHVKRLGRFRPGSPWLREVSGLVTVLVPAHNEEAGIQSTLRSLLASTHQQLQIVVIDDGSEDRTSELAAEMGDPRVLVVKQPNSGKSAALNTGLSYAESDIVVMVDGDTVLEADAIERLIQPLAHPAVGAVSGNTKVGNRKRLLGRWQHLEYVCGFNLDRRMFDVLECITTVPGAIGAFRRTALVGVGGVSDDTLAEDTDLTMALWRAGWRVVYEETAIAWTEVPTTMRQLWRQRYRWCYGTLQAMGKHRHAVREVGQAGRFARRGLTYISIFQVALPVLTPLLDVFALYGLLFGNPMKAAGVWIAFMGAQMAVAGYALKLDGERLRTLWSMPLQLFTYRLLMYLVVIQSMVTVLAGIRLNWGRMKRSGSAAQEMGGVEAAETEQREMVAVSGAVALSRESGYETVSGQVLIPGQGVPAAAGAAHAASVPGQPHVTIPGHPVATAVPGQASRWAGGVGPDGTAPAVPTGNVPHWRPNPAGTVIVTRNAPATPLSPDDVGGHGGDIEPDLGSPQEPWRPAPKSRRRPRRLRRVVIVLACLALLSPIGAYSWADNSLNRGPDLDRLSNRPLPGDGTNYLIVGSDSRSGLSSKDRENLHTGAPAGRRTDSMILLHTGKHGTTMTSLPRDSWVDMPSFIRPENGKQYGAEHNKLNAAFSYGGAPFLVKTVEKNTGLRIDHYAEIGFAGFVGIVDAVGGVDMCLDKPIKDEKSGADLKKGCQTLDGSQALSFVRQRHQESEGDLGRAKNQQKFLSALAKRAASKQVLLDPGKMRDTTKAGLKSLIVDQDTGLPGLARLAQAMQKVSQGKGKRVELPIADKYHWTDKGSSVLWDKKRANALFERLRRDEPVPAEWGAEDPGKP